MATPRHVVKGATTVSDFFTIRFFDSPNKDVPAFKLNQDSDAYDLAWLVAHLPSDMTAPSKPTFLQGDQIPNHPVWAIGDPEIWDISAHSGYYQTETENAGMRFGGMSIIPGFSGGALVTKDGIAAMVETAGTNTAYALPASRILQLMPPPYADAAQTRDSLSPAERLLKESSEALEHILKQFEAAGR